MKDITDILVLPCGRKIPTARAHCNRAGLAAVPYDPVLG